MNHFQERPLQRSIRNTANRDGAAKPIIQDSLWRNHLSKKFGNRFLDEISVAEINDYLDFLYHTEGRAYRYVESFLKMFYLIFGQAYSRNYLDVDSYNKLCVNKDIRIHMPKMKTDEDTDIVAFSPEESKLLDDYFRGTHAETAYLLSYCCGLRINECYGYFIVMEQVYTSPPELFSTPYIFVTPFSHCFILCVA